LLIFVAIPLPGSGVWTGSVLAVLFEIKPKLAMSYITIGLLIAGLLVMAITKGVFHSIQLI
ncbi:MAG: small multi-drug export protein, partial [bacterium]|nr:small multi-drug export protein [bacterium]